MGAPISDTLPQGLQSQLTQHGQRTLWNHLEGLSVPQRDRLKVELASIDWATLERVFSQHTRDDGEQGGDTADQKSTLVLKPVERMIRQPSSHLEKKQWQMATSRGASALREGRVAAVMVAGGQGTRLGLEHPKGMFPAGPISEASLYQLCCEQLLYWMKKYECSIPYIIMTSDATHEETFEFFVEHDYFGLNPDDVWFVRQGNLPAFDLATGEALLSDEHQLAMSPDGHGGLLDALTRDGIWHRLHTRGIDLLTYHQVDNPLTRICDPAFLGWHLVHRADVSTKVAKKRTAKERMGLIIDVNGVPQVVEYSDLSDEIAEMTDQDGSLRFWAGNTAMHVFNVAFLEEAAANRNKLPLHVARKLVPYWKEGILHTPKSPNAAKFERFIFDVLPLAERPLFVEVDRNVEFQPIKNRAGEDSPETCRHAMMALYRSWLQDVGVFVPNDIPVEISPMLAQESNDLREIFSAGTTILEPLYLSANLTPAYA